MAGWLAFGFGGGAVLCAVTAFRESRAKYAPHRPWCDEGAPAGVPAKYRAFSNELSPQGTSPYDAHSPETFAAVKGAPTAADIKAARMGSVTNGQLRRSENTLAASPGLLPGVVNWLQVIATTNRGLIGNTWAILAAAKQRLPGGTYPLVATPITKRSKEQFYDPAHRDAVQSEAFSAWLNVRKTLMRAAYLAEAGYSIKDLANLPSTHHLHHKIGRFGCVIESPTHPHAAAVGYKLLPPRRLCGSVDNGGAPDKIDMDVSIVFQGSDSLLGMPTTSWVGDWLCTNFRCWLTTTPDTTRLTPLPKGLNVHAGFYGRFVRMWPVILSHIEQTRAAVSEEYGAEVRVQVTVAGHSQAGALATLTAMAVDAHGRAHGWHPCCGTDLFVFSAPAMFGPSADGTFPTLDDTAVRCHRFSVDNDSLAGLAERWLEYRHPSAGDLQLSGRRCNVAGGDAHTEYSRLIREFVGPEVGTPRLHLLTAGNAGSRERLREATSTGTASSTTTPATS